MALHTKIKLEKEENQLKFTDNGKKGILTKLIQAEGFEKFLALKFVATKRFGLDGGESLIPALEQIIKRGGKKISFKKKSEKQRKERFKAFSKDW